MRAMVIGDSHTNCIAQAAAAEPARMEGIQIYRFKNKRSQPDDGTISIGDAKQLVAQMPASAPVFLCVLGTITIFWVCFGKTLRSACCQMVPAYWERFPVRTSFP